MNIRKRTIIVTGGNFVNKGAQSMLFCLIDHLANKYPADEVVVLDLFPSLRPDQKLNYRFTVLNMHVRSLFRISYPILKLLFRKSIKSDSESEIIECYKNARIVFDISGYGVSSHNQALVWSLATLLPFRLAAKYRVPVQLLPQSLGPFDFKGWKKLVVWPFIKKWMRYPERVFVREPIARHHLMPIRNEGVIDSFDLVLQAGNLETSHIFRSLPETQSVVLPSQSVVLIPNKQLFRLWGESKTVAFFGAMADGLVRRGKHAVILRHSSDDRNLCDQIYNSLSDSANVTLLNHDYYPHQMDEVIRQAEALVSARYHGLVHGLKNGIPVFAVGWAVKYDYLMQTFGLGEFHLKHDSLDLMSDMDLKLGSFFAQLPLLRHQIQLKMETIISNSIYSKFL